MTVVSYVRIEARPRRELRCLAPQFSSGYYVLTYLAIDIICSITEIANQAKKTIMSSFISFYCFFSLSIYTQY